MKKIILLLLLSCSLILGCERDALIDFPDAEPVLTVIGYVGTDMDEYIEVYVGRSNPYQDNNSNIDLDVNNASVFINNQQLEFQGFGKYTLAINENFIEPGQQYDLRVEAPNFTTVTSSCIVPEDPPQDYEINNIRREPYSYLLDLVVYDSTPELENYYAFYGRLVLIVPTQEELYESFYFYNEENIFRELDFINGRFVLNNIEERVVTNLDYDRMELRLLHTDENFYRYRTTINANDDNPFTEPVIPYSNIENGLGIWAAYHHLDKIIYLD